MYIRILVRTKLQKYNLLFQNLAVLKPFYLTAVHSACVEQ